jgi:hypothetical protein
MVSRPCGISERRGITAASTASATTSAGSVRPISRLFIRLIEKVAAPAGCMPKRRDEEPVGFLDHSPFHDTVPESASTRPRMERSRVVLPEPTRPVITVNDPAGTAKVTSSMPSSVPG